MKLRWLCNKTLLLLLCGLLASGCSSISAPEVTSTPAVAVAPASSIDRGAINLAHLNFLVEDIEIAGQPMAITHIYSEYPHYEWVDASGEGIAAVDDAARAAWSTSQIMKSTGIRLP